MMKSTSEKETKSSKGVDERLAIFGDTPITATPDEIITMVIDPPAWLETFETYGKLAESTLARAGFVFGARDFELRLLNDLTLPAELREATQLLWKINELRRENDAERRESLSLAIGALGERIKARESQPFVDCGKKMIQSGRDANERRYGTPEEKKQRYAKYQKAIDAISADVSSHNEACDKVASDFGVSSKTINRRTHWPPRR